MPRTPIDPLDAYTRYEERQRTTVHTEPTAESPFTGATESLHAAIADRVAAIRPELEALAVSLYEEPEVGYEEHKSVAKIAELLRAHGRSARVGTYGLDTSFAATVSVPSGPADPDVPGAPHFAIIAEYDALPGIGHACGHNIIAAIAAGAFIAASDALEAETGSGIVGTLSLIGTPAEEGGGGKEHIIRAGGFDTVDAAAMVHPSVGNQVSPITGSGTSGVRRIRVEYRGRAGHAALSPYLGLNALDAVVTAYQSIAQLRQHILPIDRIHGIITNGGTAANVVPDIAAAEFLIRSSEIDTLRVLTQRVIDILDAAALATGTTAVIDADFEPPYLPLRANVLLTKHWARHLETRGRHVPVQPPVRTSGGPSTDMGNVSWYIPAIHPALGLGGAPDVLPHNAAFADSTVEPPAFDALVDAAVSLASLAVDYLADEALRTAVAEEFAASGGRKRWEA